MFQAGRLSAGEFTVRPEVKFNGVKVFSATVLADRYRLGEKVTDWIAAHKQLSITQFVVTQSSDASFHCLAITVFYRDPVND